MNTIYKKEYAKHSAFTFAEVLVSMVFVAILIPNGHVGRETGFRYQAEHLPRKVFGIRSGNTHDADTAFARR